MRTCLLTIIAFLSTTTQMMAQTGWIDVTDTYVTNPRFDNNDLSGWEGTAWGAYNGHENAEHYSKDYDTYQMLSGLTPGRYRVSLSAFYRSGDARNDYFNFTSGDPESAQIAYLYAMTTEGEVYVPLALASSAALSESLGGGTSGVGDGLVIPNNMDAAYYWFEAGYYLNTLEVTVPADGQLTIGIVKDYTLSSDWTCCDNWKLEYLGELVTVKSVEITPQSVGINVDETVQLTAKILPTNATIQKLTWESLNPTVATVDADGKVTGVGRGTAEIKVTTTDGTNLTASAKVTVSYSGGSKESMIINEIMIANIDMFVDPSWNYGGWVELYNPTDQSANIGLFWVSDDPNNLKKAMLPRRIGSVPAHGFFTLWFGHADTQKDVGEKWLNTQVNLDLNVEGGTIYLSDDQGNLLTSQDYPAAIKRASYARKTDGGEEWGWTGEPTPSATNRTSRFAAELMADPEVDQPGRLFTDPFEVQVTIPMGATLMYTTDGTTPTTENGTRSKDGHFTVSETTTFRFRLFKNGYLPSGVVTRSYIYQDRDYYLPVVSVVTDPKNLYDDEIGVYVSGKNGKTANQDYTKRNFNMEWDRPVNFEYILQDENGEYRVMAVNQEVDYAIAGGWSRKYLPKSFKLKAKSLYGASKYDFPFFSDKPYNRNKTILLRNGGNDNYNKYRLKDVSLQEIARLSGFKLNLQSVQPTHVFVNGEYIAMLNMREPSNKHWAYANQGTDNDMIDSFEMSVDSGYVQKSGTRDAFDYWYNLTNELADDPQNEEIYKKICDIVDIDDYVNYFAYKFFLNDWDWPHNNCKGFRDRNDGKFRFMVFDLDNCVDRTGNNIFNDFENKRTYTFYGRPEYNGSSLTKEVELVTMFLNMLENDRFRKKFIDTYCIVGGCVFHDDAEIANIVNELAEQRRTALLWEGNDPVGSNKERSQGIINALTGQFKSRMMNAMKNYRRFGLSGAEIQAVQLGTNVAGGRFTINGIDVPKARFNGYLFAPDTLRAYDVAGYRFMGWQETEMDETITTTIFGMGDSWHYYQEGSLDEENWISTKYNMTKWSKGAAPFGFGNNGRPMSKATTVLNKTDENGNSRPTYYFRKEFDAKPTENDTYVFHYELDDGMIVYVNGQEVGTYHMPSSARYADYVQDYFDNTYEGETPYQGTMEIDRSLIRYGTNVITVEVHNCNRTSSDLWFDGSITVSRPREKTEVPEYVSTDKEYILPANGSHSLKACYERLSDAELLATGVAPVRINEVSASNAYYVNDYNKRNDWVELYNTTDEDIDLAGMYLSDNLAKQQKSEIVATEGVSTVIPAHGFRVVWCDKLEAVSQLHAAFKLAAEGGVVVLTSADGTWADTLNYCAHTDKETVGLYPDGGTDVYVFGIPTIDSNNLIGSYDSLYVYNGEESGIKPVWVNDGSMEIVYENGYLRVKSEQNMMAQLAIYKSVGQQTHREKMNLQAGETSTYVGYMPSGVYVATVTGANGETGSCKFIIK